MLEWPTDQVISTIAKTRKDGAKNFLEEWKKKKVHHKEGTGEGPALFLKAALSSTTSGQTAGNRRKGCVEKSKKRKKEERAQDLSTISVAERYQAKRRHYPCEK